MYYREYKNWPHWNCQTSEKIAEMQTTNVEKDRELAEMQVVNEDKDRISQEKDRELVAAKAQ